MTSRSRRATAVTIAVVTLVACAHASAATIAVTTTADSLANDGLCSLREAITSANTNAATGGCSPGGTGSDIVDIPAGTYVATIYGRQEGANAKGDFDVTESLALHGAGAGQTIVDGNQSDRVFDIAAGAAVTISGLTVTNGIPSTGSAAGKGESGGGIRAAGPLSLDHVTVSGNTSGWGGDGSWGGPGGDGAGVWTSAALTVSDSLIDGNYAGDGGYAVTPPGYSCTNTTQGATGGTGGNGGGIYVSAAVPVLIQRSTISNNRAGNGQPGGCAVDYPGNGGDGGSYGGIYAPQLTLTDSTVTKNLAGNGATGGSDSDGKITYFSAAGAGGMAGGVYAQSLSMTRSSITQNVAGAGGRWNGAGGMGSDGGDVGGLYAAGGTSLSIIDSTIADNHAGAGDGDLWGHPRGNGGNYGGASLSLNGDFSISGSTFSGNAPGVGGVYGHAGSFGGLSASTAIGHTLTIRNSTIAENTSSGLSVGAGATVLQHLTVASNDRGIAMPSSSSVTLINSIVASNGTNCSGTFTSLHGKNVVFGSACQGPGDNPIVSDPLLGPLADNGGPTKTKAVGAGSPALDVVPASSSECAATDQRGMTRPQGTGCDVGAFEAFVASSGADQPAIGGDQTATAAGQTSTSTGDGSSAADGASTTSAETTSHAAAPVITLRLPKQRLTKILRTGFLCTFDSNEAGNAMVKLGKLGTMRRSVRTPGRQTCVLKLPARAKRRLAAVGKLELTVTVVLTDADGNIGRASKRLTLKR